MATGIRAEIARMESGVLREIDGLLDARATLPDPFALCARVIDAEGLHSDILKWLLTPAGWHNLDGDFGVALLSRLSERSREGNVPCPVSRDAAITIKKVATEVSTGAGPVDLLIEGTWGGDPFVLGIENKIGSDEAPGQVARYARALRQRTPAGTHVFVALLTPDPCPPDPPPSIPWAALSYEDVACALEDALVRHPDDTAAPEALVGRAVARSYLSVVRRRIMNEDPQLEGLCRDLYERHRDAWREIRRWLPSELDERHRALGLELRRQLSESMKGQWAWAVRKDYYVTVFRPEWNAVFTTWRGRPGMAFAIGEQVPPIPAVHLRVKLAPADEERPTDLTLTLRLKCDLRWLSAQRQTPLRRQLAAVLERNQEKAEGDEFTIELGKTQMKSLGASPDLLDVAAHAAKRCLGDKFKLKAIVDAVDTIAR
jgi:hypothetical protein